MSRDSEAKTGLVKGEPLRYYGSHGPRMKNDDITPPNPSGYCLCGCGKKTLIAKATWRAKGILNGHPLPYIKGHKQRTKYPPKFPEGVLVDEEDRRFEPMFQWHISNWGYCHGIKQENGKKKRLLLHRLIMNCPGNMVVDHINHNTLDNRKHNLRVVTQRENSVHQRTYNRKSLSGHRNVGYSRKSKKWVVNFSVGGKCKYIGQYDDLSEAITVAQKYRREHGIMSWDGDGT